MLIWILEPKSVERASILHQPDGVGSQRHHIVPIRELNGVSIALVARSGVISKSTDRNFVFHGGIVTPSLGAVRASLNIEDEIADVILEDLQIKYEKYDKGKGKVEGDLARANQAKQAGDDVDLVDADDVDLFDALDLENIVIKLEEDFTRLLKAKKAKEAKKAEEAELKVNKVVQVSSDKGFSGDEDIVCHNDVKYPLTNVEIRMFMEIPTTSRGLKRQFASTSTRSRALIDSTKKPGSRCVLALFAPNALPPFPLQKRSPILSHT
ncbi:hypothetical protein Tco_0092149 [Tanacetum coccineum]